MDLSATLATLQALDAAQKAEATALAQLSAVGHFNKTFDYFEDQIETHMTLTRHVPADVPYYEVHKVIVIAKSTAEGNRTGLDILIEQIPFLISLEDVQKDLQHLFANKDADGKPVKTILTYEYLAPNKIRARLTHGREGKVVDAESQRVCFTALAVKPPPESEWLCVVN